MKKTSAILMTKTGYEKVCYELERKVLELQDICAERLLAHSLSGDGWHDNPYFNRLQQMEAEKTRDIANVQSIINQAKLIEINPMQRPKDHVAIGTIVKVSILYHDKDEELIQTWEIVGFNESDVALKKLAYNSPLARDLMNLTEGEDIEIMLPGGTATVEILSFLDNVN
jgi:transcription elongation factor GreA